MSTPIGPLLSVLSGESRGGRSRKAFHVERHTPGGLRIAMTAFARGDRTSVPFVYAVQFTGGASPSQHVAIAFHVKHPHSLWVLWVSWRRPHDVRCRPGHHLGLTLHIRAR